MPERKTPKEIAPSTNGPEKNEWMQQASIPELHELIYHISTRPDNTDYQRARTALEVRIAEALIESVGKVEASSCRLEKHTVHLKRLTVVLVILTAVLACQTYLLIRAGHP
jgi:hypothetical protein